MKCSETLGNSISSIPCSFDTAYRLSSWTHIGSRTQCSRCPESADHKLICRRSFWAANNEQLGISACSCPDSSRKLTQPLWPSGLVAMSCSRSLALGMTESRRRRTSRYGQFGLCASACGNPWNPQLHSLYRASPLSKYAATLIALLAVSFAMPEFSFVNLSRYKSIMDDLNQLLLPSSFLGLT